MWKLLVICLAALVLSGCLLLPPSTRTDGGRISASKSVATNDSGTTTEKLTVEVEGPSGKTTQDGGAQGLRTTSPTIRLNGIEVGTGALGIQSEGGGWESTLANPAVMLGAIGGIVVLCSIGYGFFTKDWRGIVIPVAIGLGVSAVGLVFLKYPAVIAGLFLIAVAGIIYYLWQRHKKQQAAGEAHQVSETLSVVTRAIETVGEEDRSAAEKVKARVQALAGKFAAEVKAVVGKAKNGTLLS